MIWARKKTGAPVIRINSEAEANEFLKQHAVHTVGLFDKFEVCGCQELELLHNSLGFGMKYR